MTHREIAQRAATILETEGWCQGDYRLPKDEGGYAYCLVGACREAAGCYAALAADALADALYDALATARAAYTAALDAYLGPSGWNDAPERTVAEVIAALRGVK